MIYSVIRIKNLLENIKWKLLRVFGSMISKNWEVRLFQLNVSIKTQRKQKVVSKCQSKHIKFEDNKKKFRWRWFSNKMW